MLDKLKSLFSSSSDNPNQEARREQIKTAAVIAVIVLCAYGFYLWSSHQNQTHKVAHEELHFDGTFDSHFDEHSDEALIAQQQTQIDAIKLMVIEKRKQQSEVSFKAEPLTQAIVSSLSQKIAHLEEQNKKTQARLKLALLSMSQKSSKLALRPPSREEQRFRQKQKARHSQSAGLETITFHHKKNKTATRTPETYVWAGTFVSGIMLTGVMGDAGLNGAKNTGNVLIRLDENGTMPNGRVSHLKDCFVLGSSFGDLSGDSVVIHTETLSCAGRLNFEQAVYGSVFDRDAMQDLRGTSILKTKPLLGYTAAAGLLAGIGDGLQNYGSAQSLNSNGSVTTFSTSSLARSAGGGALSNPANKISEYIMKIADIYHPLVVARPGRRVSVLFIKGFWIDKAHQKYESGHAIDNKHASKYQSIETHVTRGPSAAMVARGSQSFPGNDFLKAGTLPSHGFAELKGVRHV